MLSQIEDFFCKCVYHLCCCAGASIDSGNQIFYSTQCDLLEDRISWHQILKWGAMSWKSWQGTSKLSTTSPTRVVLVGFILFFSLYMVNGYSSPLKTWMILLYLEIICRSTGCWLNAGQHSNQPHLKWPSDDGRTKPVSLLQYTWASIH